MAAQSNALMSALKSVVSMHPRLSAGLAFELGVMVGSYVKAARRRRGLAGSTAKLIEAMPLISRTLPARRKPAVRRRKPAKRGRIAGQRS